jgi:SAM-dependent methyltransferase
MSGHQDAELIRMRLSRVARACSGAVLDVGCGQRLLEEYIGRISYIGIDIQGGNPKGSATDLPFMDISFDTVVMCEILEHLEDPRRAIREACRVARERVIITVPNEYSLVRLARVALGIELEPEALHLADLNLSHISRALAENGFTVVESYSYPIRIQLLPPLPIKSRFGYWTFVRATRASMA